jgi:hypothetical protein
VIVHIIAFIDRQASISNGHATVFASRKSRVSSTFGVGPASLAHLQTLSKVHCLETGRLIQNGLKPRIARRQNSGHLNNEAGAKPAFLL